MAREAKPRDTYKYVVKIGKRVVHKGVTSDLKRREAEQHHKFSPMDKMKWKLN